jgi:hypothetical protein
VRVYRIWKRDGTRTTIPGEVAVEVLCKNALDANLRQQGAAAIQQRLANGEAVETEHAVYVNTLAAGVTAKARGAARVAAATQPVKMGVGLRRQAFRALVALQDSGVGADSARVQIAGRFGIPAGQVRQIEEEGLAKDWPLE